MTDFIEEGFEELEEHGYTSDMVSITRGKDGGPTVIRPAFDLKCCMGVGYPKGTKMRFLSKNGYEMELNHARETFNDQPVTVKMCYVGDWYSHYEFEEVAGRWNKVMFEKVS